METKAAGHTAVRSLRRTLLVLSLLGCGGPTVTPAPAPTRPSPSVPVPAVTKPAGPPVAAVVPVEDVYFGTRVVDPYRWMEKPSSEFDDWLEGQADFARSALDRLPGRDALLERLRVLHQGRTDVWSVQARGSRLFYLKVAPGDQGAKLFVQDGASAERVLFDPATLANGAGAQSLDFYSASPSGARVAVGVSLAGTEDSVLHVLDGKTGNLEADAIDRCREARVSWLDDGSFVYSRHQVVPPGSPPATKNRRVRAYAHKAGSDPATDKAILGFDVAPGLTFDEDDYASVRVPASASWALGVVTHGVAHELTLYVAPRSGLRATPVPWKKIADASTDAVTDLAVHGEDVYLLTHAGAPRFTIVRTSLSRPYLAHATTVVAEAQGVLTGLAAAKDALYVGTRDGAVTHVSRVGYAADAKPETVPLPFEGSLGRLNAQADAPGVRFAMESWTEPPRWLIYDPRTRTVSDTKLIEVKANADPGVETIETTVPSADGTLVPISVVRRRERPRDGSSPTILDGYGAYGEVLDSTYSPQILAWIERGGTVATCHTRGGGEYGEAWHRDGMLGKKQNAIDDYLACARWLCDQKLTSAGHLALRGGSAGAILVGGAITQHPELFGAAVVRNGLLDPLRAEQTAAGANNVPERGSVATEAGFRALLASDAYQHVKDGVRYPAVLLTTGARDVRVSSWQPGKMAARLQAASASGRPVLLRVGYEAGHGHGETTSARLEEAVDVYAFLEREIGN